jgi:thiazole tautomerase (transcriptional regulator TenI)
VSPPADGVAFLSSPPAGTRPLAVPRLHAVTTDEVVGRGDFLAVARAVMRAGGARVAVQLRASHLAVDRVLLLAVALAAAQEETGAHLVVNDRVDVALAAGARGVQLTSQSMRVADARRIAPALAIGASVHAVAEAREAERTGATWCVAGHVFETATHPGATPRGLAFVAEVVRAVSIPVIGIGGVRPELVPQLRAAGAYGIAAIRGIWDAPNAERATIDYLSSYDSL